MTAKLKRLPLAQPTADDYAACLVALDLVEEGRTREAEQLLIQQAPNRHNRKCPACGARIAVPCRDTDAVADEPRGVEVHRRFPLGMTTRTETKRTARDRIVPHLSRVEPNR